MKLSDYKQVSFQRFNGLYSRGDADSVPKDHAVFCNNVWLNDPGNINLRPGSKDSFALSHLSPVCVNQFLATGRNGDHFITMDGFGNIYEEHSVGNSTIIWPAGGFSSYAGIIDFAALNMFGRTYINIITDGSYSEPIKVWSGLGNARDAAGNPPGYTPPPNDFKTLPLNGGVVSEGIHKIAVVFETDTGYLTQPGPLQTIGDPTSLKYAQSYSDGNDLFQVYNIPKGIANAGVVARRFIMTKGNEEQYFFVPNGRIADNTTTSPTGTVTINCSDGELVEDASYLFDNLYTIPGGRTDGGLNKYHGRMLVWGGEGDLIRVSYPGDPESFSNVTGYIQLPTETDGNYVKGTFILRDVLYMTKGVGIFSTQDLTGDEPSNWPVTIIDGAKGAWNSGISTITSSQPGLPLNDCVLLVDFDGINVFSGVVQQPALTWKIKNIWDEITHGKNPVEMQQITIAADPFLHVIYVLLPFAGYNMLVGDYTEGLDAMNVKWTTWVLPDIARSMSLCNVKDKDNLTSGNYWLRLGFKNHPAIVKFQPTLTTDFANEIIGGYQFAYVPIELGSLNIYRAARFRAKGDGNLNIEAIVQDGHSTNDIPPIALAPNPIKDYFREINVMGEKMSLIVTTNNNFNISRVDLFGGTKVKTRPA